MKPAVTPPIFVAVFTALYTSQGLPYGFFALALPALLREAGWSLTAINLLQILGLPWVLKFLWAPWFDHALNHGRGLHDRRRWLLLLQTATSAVALGGAAWCFWQGHDGSLPLPALMILVFGFNLLASTQDILTDGLAVRELSVSQRGWANGMQVGAYRLGMILGGGGLLWSFAQSGWAWMLVAMGLALGLLTVPLWLWRPMGPAAPAQDVLPSEIPTPRTPRKLRAWMMAWWQRAKAPHMRMALLLIVAYRWGDQWVSNQLTPFLADQNLGTATLAIMKGTVGSAASLVGALLGGWWLMRVSRRSALWFAGWTQSAAFAMYLVATLIPGHDALLWAATILEGLLGTLATVALFAWMMDVADPQHAGADYTLMASAVVLTGSVAGFAGAVVGDLWGYTATFAAGTVMSIAGIWAMVRWQDKWPLHARVAQAWGHAPEHATTASVL